MEHNQQQTKDSVYGIEREIIEEFFSLIEFAYPLADKANYFLELETNISGINIGVTNLRDILSHLQTLISDKHLSYEQKKAQLSNAEEHLRRAIIEPYYKAAMIIIEKDICRLYPIYKNEVLPLKESEPILVSAPTREQIDLRISLIKSELAQGREAKRINKLAIGWIEGVENLIKTFETIKQLRSTFEEYIMRANQIRINKQQIEHSNTQEKHGKLHMQLGVTHIVIAVLLFVITLVAEYFIIAPGHNIPPEIKESNQAVHTDIKPPSNKQKSP